MDCSAIASQTHWPSFLSVGSPWDNRKYGGHGKLLGRLSHLSVASLCCPIAPPAGARQGRRCQCQTPPGSAPENAHFDNPSILPSPHSSHPAFLSISSPYRSNCKYTTLPVKFVVMVAGLKLDGPAVDLDRGSANQFIGQQPCHPKIRVLNIGLDMIVYPPSYHGLPAEVCWK